MATTLNVQKQLAADRWVITATITSDEIPTAIFAYLNEGTTQLGEYQGVVSPLDLPRIKIWDGSIIAAFGNKFLRHTTATINVVGSDSPDAVITELKDSVTQFRKDFLAAQNSSESFTIT
jgi:vancomycin resistance protein YoaR